MHGCNWGLFRLTLRRDDRNLPSLSATLGLFWFSKFSDPRPAVSLRYLRISSST